MGIIFDPDTDTDPDKSRQWKFSRISKSEFMEERPLQNVKGEIAVVSNLSLLNLQVSRLILSSL